MKNNILIIGGAGYIGSTVARVLEKKFNICILDNLVTGNKKLVKKKYSFFNFNCGDKIKLKKLIDDKNISIVIHLAASLSVEDSKKNKKYYYKNNFINTKNIIDVCNKSSNIKKIIFSSTCAVYGSPKSQLNKMNEKVLRKPISYYGYTKKLCEDYIIKKSNKKYIILRYFNVVGSEPQNTCGLVDKKSKQLFSNLNRSILSKTRKINIYGNNYNTKDGTCVRDYIHVSDIAGIHLKAINFLNKKKSIIINCGYNKGFSVKEIIDKYEKIFKLKFKRVIKKPREGDPANVVCDNLKLVKNFNWKPRYNNLEKMIISSYLWYKKFLNN